MQNAGKDFPIVLDSEGTIWYGTATSSSVYRQTSPVCQILGWTTLLSPFTQRSERAGRLGRTVEQTQREKAEDALLAMKEFKRYLEGLERDLSRTSKKYSNREVAQGAGFVAAGVHEALNYLEIVKKVIVKTERVVAKRNLGSESATIPTR